MADLERLDRVEREAEALTAATRAAYAFNDPRRLDREWHNFQSRAGLLQPVREAFARAKELVAQVEAQRNRD